MRFGRVVLTFASIHGRIAIEQRSLHSSVLTLVRVGQDRGGRESDVLWTDVAVEERLYDFVVHPASRPAVKAFRDVDGA